MKIKKYLLTGGAGFIGSNLVRKLVDLNQKVFVLENSNCDIWRINDLLKSINLFEVDITDFEKLRKVVFEIKPDVIFHFASLGVDPSQQLFKKLFEVNFHGTVNLLYACEEVGFEYFVNTGTSSEYGSKSDVMKESDVLVPVTNYGLSKAAATQFCVKEAITKKLPIHTFRPFTVYGNYESQYRLIPSIIINYLKNRSVNLSSKNFVRDFIYIDDVVDFYLFMEDYRPEKPYIYNLGTYQEHKIIDVVKIFEKIVNKKLKINWGKSKPRPWELKHWCADMGGVENATGWFPNYELKEGLKKALSWFEKNISLYK